YDPFVLQDAHVDGQIKRGAFLAEVGRGQVDGDLALGKAEAAVAQRRTDPLATFPHRQVRKPDHREHGQPGREVHLHLDGVCVQSAHCHAVDLRQHAPSADETVQTGKRYNGRMLRLVSLAVACAIWATSAAGEPSRPLVGHIMALLAVFEEADVLPPEASPDGNALIHALIQTQAALTKSTNPATRGWFAEALRSSESPEVGPDPREGLTSRALEAIVAYAETHPPTARPDVMAGFQEFNVSAGDL